MKPPPDDEVNRDQLVTRVILGPEFQAAWETLKGSGIGSTEATAACWEPSCGRQRRVR
jgi:hypothetical protein